MEFPYYFIASKILGERFIMEFPYYFIASKINTRKSSVSNLYQANHLTKDVLNYFWGLRLNSYTE